MKIVDLYAEGGGAAIPRPTTLALTGPLKYMYACMYVKNILYLFYEITKKNN